VPANLANTPRLVSIATTGGARRFLVSHRNYSLFAIDNEKNRPAEAVAHDGVQRPAAEFRRRHGI
jgi:hypothetical protein